MPFFGRGWNPYDLNPDGTPRLPWENERISGQPVPYNDSLGGAGQGMRGSAGFNSAMDIISRIGDRYGGGSGSRNALPGIIDSISNARDTLRKRGLPAGAGVFESINKLNAPPSMADIMARLEELQDPNRYLMDDSQLAEQAMASASAKYDPLIAALRGQMSSASDRANRNKTALGQMFGSLSGSLQGELPKINQQFTGAKKQTAGQYKELQGDIKEQYADSQQEQEDTFKRLGIEAAMSEVLPEQMKDRDYFTALAATEGQTQQDALGLEQNNTVNFTREGSQIAQVEGTQRQADLMTQLQDLLAEYENQIGAHSAAKQSEYVANLGQLQSSMLQQAYDRSDREAANYLEMINLGRALRRDEMEMGAMGSAVGMEPVKSPADVANRALGLGLGQRDAQTIQDVFMSTVGSDPTILSGREAMFGQNVPREALAQRVVEAGRKRGLSGPELNALMTIALEYFGRR